MLAGPIFWPIEESPELLRFYRDWIADAPDELMTIVIHRRAPAVPFVPAELHGELVAAVACCYAGPIEDGEAVVRPLREFGSPVLDLCRPKPYLENQSMFDPSYPHGWWYYVRACDVAELTDDVIDVTAEHARRIVSPVGGFPIWQLGGAVARVGDGDTAFNGRGAGHTFNLTATTKTEDGFEDEREWARTFWSALEPYHAGVYVNFLMDEGQERVRQAYGAEKYDRLQALKRRYDPDNLLRLNQNIPPPERRRSECASPVRLPAMRVVVIGATGHVGTYLVPRLVRARARGGGAQPRRARAVPSGARVARGRADRHRPRGRGRGRGRSGSGSRPCAPTR